MKKDRILVLDIDGTLADSVSMHQQALLGAMQALRLARLNTDWSSYPDHTDIGILAHALADHGIQLTDKDVVSFEEDLDRRFAALLAVRGLVEIAGARAFVQASAHTRWGVVFATGGTRAVSVRKLHALGISFDESTLITSSEHISRRHLVMAAVNRAMAYYGIASPQTVLSVGDGLWDLRAARELGVEFVGVGAPGSMGASPCARMARRYSTICAMLRRGCQIAGCPTPVSIP